MRSTNGRRERIVITSAMSSNPRPNRKLFTFNRSKTLPTNATTQNRPVTEGNTKDDVGGQRDSTDNTRPCRYNPEVDRLIRESAHLDISDRLAIGKFVASGGFSSVYQGGLSTSVMAEPRRVAVKELHNFRSDVKIFQVCSKLPDGNVGYITTPT